jgi:ABC-2 type transport system permease protein
MGSNKAVIASFRQQVLHFVADPQWVVPSLIAPFTFTIVALMLYRDVDGPVVLYAVLGGGVLGMWGNTLYSSGWSINFDRMNGTLEPLMITPTPLIKVILGRALWNATIGLSNALLVFLVAEVAFGAEVGIADPPMFFLALLLTLLSLASIGLAFSAFFVFTRASSVLMTTLEFPIYVASGAMFPLTVLPEWTRPVSYLIAPTWGVDALRTAGLDSYEPILSGMLLDLVPLALLTSVYLLIAWWLFRRLERKVLMDGSLGRW